MDRKPNIEKLKAVSKWNPETRYEWNPEDLFTVSGAEIDSWNKALAVMVNTPEFQRFTTVQRAAILMNDFIKQGVEQDLIKPVKKVEEKEEDGPIEQVV